jgi:hypothetical protein
MEILKPNPKDCKGCKDFVKKGRFIADRFLVKEDACALRNTGKQCKYATDTILIKPGDSKQS